MKNEEKRMIAIIIIIGIIIVVGLLIWKNTKAKRLQSEKVELQNTIVEKNTNVLEDGTKLNKSDKLKQTKKLHGMEISQIQLTYKDGQSILIETVTKTTNKDIDLTPIKVTLYDDQNNILEQMNGLISPVKAGESVQLNMGIGIDHSNAYDLTIEQK